MGFSFAIFTHDQFLEILMFTYCQINNPFYSFGFIPRLTPSYRSQKKVEYLQLHNFTGFSIAYRTFIAPGLITSPKAFLGLKVL